MEHLLNRRTLLKGAFGAGAALMMPRVLTASPQAPVPSASAFRFVHLTDIHVQPELSADRGMAAALAAVEALDPKPDFIIGGGDQIFDAFEQNEVRSKLLFDMFRRVKRENTNLPFHFTMGNHDVFGWSPKSGVQRDHGSYGKKMACDCMELAVPYFHFDHKGWRFFILDTIQPTADNRYEGGLDEAQMDWFERELAAKPPAMPAVVVTHIPIVTITCFQDGPRGFEGDRYLVSTGIMCRGAGKLMQLLSQHNVRLALSGHTHEIDRIESRGVTYINDGAVSGNWWKGAKNGYEEGFGILDLQADGTFEHRYYDFGWTPPA